MSLCARSPTGVPVRCHRHLKNPTVSRCLQQSSRTWRFGFGTGATEITYPFHFRCAW